MVNSRTESGDAGSPLRFTIRVRLNHPTIPSEEISDGMGIAAEHAWNVGDQRTTPNGTILPGRRNDTYWTTSLMIFGSRYFFDELLSFLDAIEHSRNFVRSLIESGGSACIDIGLHGENNIGDVIDKGGINRILEFGFSLGVEVFPDMKIYRA